MVTLFFILCIVVLVVMVARIKVRYDENLKVIVRPGKHASFSVASETFVSGIHVLLDGYIGRFFANKITINLERSDNDLLEANFVIAKNMASEIVKMIEAEFADVEVELRDVVRSNGDYKYKKTYLLKRVGYANKSNSYRNEKSYIDLIANNIHSDKVKIETVIAPVDRSLVKDVYFISNNLSIKNRGFFHNLYIAVKFIFHLKAFVAPNPFFTARLLFSKDLVKYLNRSELLSPIFCCRVTIYSNTKSSRKFERQVIASMFTSEPLSHLVPRKFTWYKRLMNCSSIITTNEISMLSFSAIFNSKNINLASSNNHGLQLQKNRLKDGYDVIIGKVTSHGVEYNTGLDDADRERHTLILGGTGNGKSTLLKYQIVQDMWRGVGVILIDPHGDLAKEVIGYVPKERVKDVIYFNPIDFEYPIGLNLLEVEQYGTDIDRKKFIEQTAESIITSFRKFFSDDEIVAHRIEYVLRNAIYTVFYDDKPTLFSIYRLLNDKSYRTRLVRKVIDEDLKRFWNDEYSKSGSFQQVKMTSGVSAKIGRFIFSESAKRVFGQTESSISFDEVLSSNRILICNFAKGELGDDVSSLFGSMVLSKIQMSALKRGRSREKDRKAYYVYVDEFQSLSSGSFSTLFSESRKFRVYFVMATQSLLQLPVKVQDVLMTNTGNLVSFRTGNFDDDKFIIRAMEGLKEGDVQGLDSFYFYLKTRGNKSEKPILAKTIEMKRKASEGIAKQVILNTRSNYVIKDWYKNIRDVEL